MLVLSRWDLVCQNAGGCLGAEARLDGALMGLQPGGSRGAWPAWGELPQHTGTASSKGSVLLSHLSHQPWCTGPTLEDRLQLPAAIADLGD